MGRRRRNQGLIDIAVNSRWAAAAWVAIGAFVLGFVFLPLVLSTSRLTASLIGIPQTLLGLLGFLFAGIAAVKFLGERIPGFHRIPFPRSIGDGTRRGSAESLTGSAADAESGGAPGRQSSRLRTESAEKPVAWSLELLQSIEWKRYEDLCAAYYREKGIHCETTPLGADGGVDIRFFQDENSDQATAVVQCKAWGGRLVGVKPVRELLGVMTHEKLHKGFFMAPGGFTDDACEFARANRITLLDGKLFLAMLDRLPIEASRRLLEFATAGDYATPTCPRCGIKMMERSGARGPFWGCRNYPRCREILQMRKPAF